MLLNTHFIWESSQRAEPKAKEDCGWGSSSQRTELVLNKGTLPHPRTGDQYNVCPLTTICIPFFLFLDGVFIEVILSLFHHWIYWVLSICGERGSRKHIILVERRNLSQTDGSGLSMTWNLWLERIWGCTSGEWIDMVYVWEEDQNGYLVTRGWSIEEPGKVPTCFQLLRQTRKLDFSVSLVFRSWRHESCD